LAQLTVECGAYGSWIHARTHGVRSFQLLGMTEVFLSLHRER
jgi:hypothetical protein